ncbi:hypothetical protein BLOT_001035 [Blomia tropicalis]|nr:hypothetical protein BLOT_001035 [Blomia tropicalis]
MVSVTRSFNQFLNPLKCSDPEPVCSIKPNKVLLRAINSDEPGFGCLPTIDERISSHSLNIVLVTVLNCKLNVKNRKRNIVKDNRFFKNVFTKIK